MRALTRSIVCCLLFAACTTPHHDPRRIEHRGGDGPGRGKHIVLLAGDEEYRSEEALPMLAGILAERHGFRCTVLFSQDPESGEIDPDEQTHIPGIELVDDADLVLMFLRFRELPDEDMRHVVEYVEAGRPLVAIRTSTHAFQYARNPESPYAHWDWRSKDWPGGFGRQVLGETWVAHHGHHGKESTRGVIPAAARSHPVLRGVSDVWGPTDVYAVRDLPADAQVLLEGSVRAGMEPSSPAVQGEKNTPRMPIAWTRAWPSPSGRTARIFASTIGAATDLSSEDLRRMYINACFWAVGLEQHIPERADVRPIADYSPTAFGFGGYRKGVFPVDHAR